MRREDRAERKKEAVFEKTKCKSLEDFQRLGAKLGYKPEWAEIQYQLKASNTVTIEGLLKLYEWRPRKK